MACFLAKALSLDAAGTVSGGKRFDFLHGHKVEIVFDRMLEARCRNGKVDSILRAALCRERIDEPSTERIAAAEREERDVRKRRTHCLHVIGSERSRREELHETRAGVPRIVMKSLRRIGTNVESSKSRARFRDRKSRRPSRG